jgi:hypothetical protein
MKRSQFFQRLGIGALVCSFFPKEELPKKETKFYHSGKLVGFTDDSPDIDNLKARGTMSAYELEKDKIDVIDEGIIYVSYLGIWLPVEEYIKLRQSGMIV